MDTTQVAQQAAQVTVSIQTIMPFVMAAIALAAADRWASESLLI